MDGRIGEVEERLRRFLTLKAELKRDLDFLKRLSVSDDGVEELASAVFREIV